MNIIPAILPKNFKELEEKVPFLVGVSDLYHLDISDGKFTPNTTWPFCTDGNNFNNIVSEKDAMPKWDKIDFEVHLMTKDTGIAVVDWVKAGAVRIIVHIEDLKGDALHNIIEEWGNVAEFSLAIRFETSIEELANCANDVRHLHIMTIEKIGFQGQKLASGAIERIKEIRKRFPDHIITVDGGVNEENVVELIGAGADRLIVGSAIWERENPKETARKFLSLKL
ncbi:MAG: hypothetical protein H7831_13875 [Magnetococcus sp. WYHC-3]